MDKYKQQALEVLLAYSEHMQAGNTEVAEITIELLADDDLAVLENIVKLACKQLGLPDKPNICKTCKGPVTSCFNCV